MPKTCTLHVRMEPTLKVKAEKILEEMGITSSEAINMFYNQICIKSGMPFELTTKKKNNASNSKNAPKRKSLFGVLNKYANPDLIEKEKDVWYEEAHE